MKLQIALLLLCLKFSICAADWPQYRGPNHDGSTSEKIAKQWPADGPKQLWKVPLHDGFSSITVSEGRAFTLVKRSLDGADREVCVALDANSGKELWAVPLGISKYQGGGDSGASGNKGGDGPRSTPAVDGGEVYAFSSQLLLVCIDAASGKEIWKKNLLKENAGRNISWENAASPLIDGNLIFVAGGGQGQALLGLDKKTGQVVWKGEDDLITHSTPTAATILGVRQVIFFTQKGLVSVAPKTGAVLWRFPFRYNTSTAMSPVVGGDIIYCSAGYGVGAAACKIAKAAEKFSATQLWFQPAKNLNNHWSTPVFKDGYLYGLFGTKEYGSAPLKCVELSTGNVMWSQDGFGPGGTTVVGGQLLVLGDAGQLVLAEATPKSYSELARAKILEGKCWSTPSMANGRVYARSTKEGVCLDVAPQIAAEKK